jgi:P pilus assembly chaperone PapD
MTMISTQWTKLIPAMALVLPLTMVTATPAAANPTIKISRIWYDSPGKDTRTNASLNGEYIVIKNSGTKAQSLAGWTIKDVTGYTYTFGTFTLGAGKNVTVRTGKGTNTSTVRYWGRIAYVWNNDKDTGFLRNKAGALVHKCSYISTPAAYKNC